MADKIRGKIYNPRKEFSINWKIDDYFSIPQKADRYIDSPTFHCLNASWYFRIYPNGERSSCSVEFVDLFLLSTDHSTETENMSVNIMLGIRGNDGKAYRSIVYCRVKFEQNKRYGKSLFVERSELWRNKHLIALDGTVTLFAIVKQSSYMTDTSSQTASVHGSLFRDFSNLLKNKQKTDVAIKLKNREFQAHKLILGARSSVFAAMFKYDMKENATGVVNLEDYDPDAFYEFLLFMYTGQIEELSPQNVFQLFTLSDMYDVGDLKEKCLDFMKENLTLDIACDVVVVADRHGEAELKDLAKSLIVCNMRSLISTPQWIRFMRENATLAAELLMTVIPEDKTIFAKKWGPLHRAKSLQYLK